MKCILILLLCLPFSILLSQSSSQYIISTQGDFSKTESLSLSWTIGDLMTEAGVFDKSIVTQGFQQPVLSVREIRPDKVEDALANDPNALGSAITNRNSNEFTASVYPNPVGTDVTIEIENSKKEYYVDLFDPAGNLLLRNRSSNPKEVIQLSDLPAAQYVLRISLLDSRQTRVFQIIKSR